MADLKVLMVSGKIPANLRALANQEVVTEFMTIPSADRTAALAILNDARTDVEDWTASDAVDITDGFTSSEIVVPEHVANG